MRSFLSRNKYGIMSLVAVVVTLAALALFIVPKAAAVGTDLAEIRSEVRIAGAVQGNVVSPDSLIAEYNKVSAQIEKYVNAQVSSSKILTFIHGSAEREGVALRDLSTGDVSRSAGKIEIPVSFRANSTFAALHRFLTDLENGAYCTRLQSVNMNREENGRVEASVRLSVMSKGGAGE